MSCRLLVLMLLAAWAAACTSSSTTTEPSSLSTPLLQPSPGRVSSASADNTKGIGGAMLAFYDSKLFTINFTELPPGGESANLARNGSINIIYQSDGCMPGGRMFVSVIDAIPTDGFNPLWEEVQVNFKTPAACQQFTSDDQILAAAKAGVVTLAPTTELYRCSVIGAKP